MKIKHLKLVANITFYLVGLAGLAAKVKKDITTHRQHENHNPCTCDGQCLHCLFTR